MVLGGPPCAWPLVQTCAGFLVCAWRVTRLCACWAVLLGAWLHQSALPPAASHGSCCCTFSCAPAPGRLFLVLTPRITAEKVPESVTAVLSAGGAERCLWTPAARHCTGLFVMSCQISSPGSTLPDTWGLRVPDST